MNRLRMLLVFFLLVGHLADAQQKNSSVALPQQDVQWIQKVLDSWAYVCKEELTINPNPLPWMIFYDSTAAWHINPETNLLPPYEKTAHQFLYEGKQYELVRISQRLTVWVPDRSPVAMGTLPMAAMPYDGSKKAFFIAPLPSLFHLLAPSETASLDLVFLGTTMHEVTHTRQLPFVVPKIEQVQHDYHLPEDIDDNTIEHIFEKNEAYKKLFFAEKTQLWNAVFAESTDSCITYIEEAFSIAAKRKKDFFPGDSLGFDKVDELFNSLEGSAMWAQYRTILKNFPQRLTKMQMVGWVMERAPAWSQEKGLALFMIIDRLDPDWKKHFFGSELPAAIDYLRNLIALKKRKR